MEKKPLHLAQIRVIVRRMTVGSSLLELWCVLLVAALLGVAQQPQRARFAWLALFFAVVFWVFDAHLSRQRRLFERTYARVHALPEARIDFSMDTQPVDGEATAWSRVFLSPRLALFYGGVIAAIALTALV